MIHSQNWSLTFDPRCSGNKYTYEQPRVRLFGVAWTEVWQHFTYQVQIWDGIPPIYASPTFPTRTSPPGALWVRRRYLLEHLVSKKAEYSELLFGAYTRFLPETWILMEEILLSTGEKLQLQGPRLGIVSIPISPWGKEDNPSSRSLVAESVLWVHVRPNISVPSNTLGSFPTNKVTFHIPESCLHGRRSV